MTHRRSLYLGASASVLLLISLSGSAAAQRGTLTGTLTGHRTHPAGDTLALQITMQITPGWHIGAGKPGRVGVPTVLKWQFPPGWRVITSHWPTPTATIIGRDTVFEYRGVLRVETIAVTAGPDRPRQVRALVSYGICREVCIPGRLELAYEAQ